jgi:thiol-disulfide isomerase/thioredoxin
MKRSVIIICTLCIHIMAQAQVRKKTPYPNVGETLPDYTFYDLVNYPKKTASIKDFRGKWLILDFWGYSCTSCIASFPKMDTLADEFKDSVQLIMVAATKTVAYKGAPSSKKIVKITKDLYTHLNKKWHMAFTNAFDSVLYLKHDVGGLPHILVIDPLGVLKYKTMHIETDQVRKILRGEDPNLIRSFSRSEPRLNAVYNPNIPLLTTGGASNGGIDTNFLFRSVLTKNSDEMPPYTVTNLYASNDPSVSRGRLEVFNYSLKNLYQVAFFGAEIYRSDDDYSKRSLDIQYGSEGVKKAAENIVDHYCYSLSIPKIKSTPDFLMKSMQLDLERFFGFKGRIEKRDMPVYYMELTDTVKANGLIAKASEVTATNGNYDHREFVNYPFEEFRNVLSAMMHIKIPVINNTGISNNITINIQANMTDINDVLSKLPNYGLKMVKGVKKMDVIVLSEN